MYVVYASGGTEVVQMYPSIHIYQGETDAN